MSQLGIVKLNCSQTCWRSPSVVGDPHCLDFAYQLGFVRVFQRFPGSAAASGLRRVFDIESQRAGRHLAVLALFDPGLGAAVLFLHVMSRP